MITKKITLTYPILSYPIELISKEFDYHLIYITDDIEVIDRPTLKKISEDLGCQGQITLHTNAGVDLHSSEKSLYGITVKRLSPKDKEQLLKKIQ